MADFPPQKNEEAKAVVEYPWMQRAADLCSKYFRWNATYERLS